MQISARALMCLTLFILSANSHGAGELPLTSMEKKPVEFVMEDKQTQNLQRLRMSANDGDADDMLELADELLQNPKLKKTDLPAIKQLIDTAEIKLGPKKVEFMRGIFNGYAGQLNGTTTMKTYAIDMDHVKPQSESLDRPKDKVKAQKFSTCSAILFAGNEYTAQTDAYPNKDLILFQTELQIAAVLYSDFDTMLEYFTPIYNSHAIQARNHPEQLKQYLPTATKECMAIYEKELPILKVYGKSARNDFEAGVNKLGGHQ